MFVWLGPLKMAELKCGTWHMRHGWVGSTGLRPLGAKKPSKPGVGTIMPASP